MAEESHGSTGVYPIGVEKAKQAAYPYLHPKSMEEKETPPARKNIIPEVSPSRPSYDMLEEAVRANIQQYIQDMLEEDRTEFLGRMKSERGKVIDGFNGYRNGHGALRKRALMGGTITIRRPQARGTEEPFESAVLPFFKRRTKEVGNILPELYLHGLARGDFAIALRACGETARPFRHPPLPASHKAAAEYAQGKIQDLPVLNVVYQWADCV